MYLSHQVCVLMSWLFFPCSSSHITELSNNIATNTDGIILWWITTKTDLAYWSMMKLNWRREKGRLPLHRLSKQDQKEMFTKTCGLDWDITSGGKTCLGLGCLQWGHIFLCNCTSLRFFATKEWNPYRLMNHGFKWLLKIPCTLRVMWIVVIFCNSTIKYTLHNSYYLYMYIYLYINF